MTNPVFHIVLQHHTGDCSIAALASLLCVSYDEVLIVASRLDENVLKNGLDAEETCKVIVAFGKSAQYWANPEDVDLSEAQGILGVKPKGRGRQIGHVVVLSNGLIFDPAEKISVVWDAELFLQHYKMNLVDFIEIMDPSTKETA